MSKQLLTVKEVAEQLSISPTSVYRLVAGGKLTKHRLGGSTRFSPSELEALVAQSRQSTEASDEPSA